MHAAASTSTKYHAERNWSELESMTLSIYDKRRNRLMPGKVNDLLYCYHNIRLIQSAYSEAEEEADRMRMLGMEEEDLLAKDDEWSYIRSIIR